MVYVSKWWNCWRAICKYQIGVIQKITWTGCIIKRYCYWTFIFHVYARVVVIFCKVVKTIEDVSVCLFLYMYASNVFKSHHYLMRVFTNKRKSYTHVINGLVSAIQPIPVPLGCFVRANYWVLQMLMKSRNSKTRKSLENRKIYVQLF